MTTINDISDFARILREHPEWRETVRGLVLGEEVSQLPQKLASFIEATHENFRLVHERMERFETGQNEMRTEIWNPHGDWWNPHGDWRRLVESTRRLVESTRRLAASAPM